MVAFWSAIQEAEEIQRREMMEGPEVGIEGAEEGAEEGIEGAEEGIEGAEEGIEGAEEEGIRGTEEAEEGIEGAEEDTEGTEEDIGGTAEAMDETDTVTDATPTSDAMPIAGSSHGSLLTREELMALFYKISPVASGSLTTVGMVSACPGISVCG